MHAPVIAPSLFQELLTVEASRSAYGLDYRPCRVQLVTGEWRDWVYIVEAEPFVREWGIAPEDDHAKIALSLDDVVHIEESSTDCRRGWLTSSTRLESPGWATASSS